MRTRLYFALSCAVGVVLSAGVVMAAQAEARRGAKSGRSSMPVASRGAIRSVAPMTTPRAASMRPTVSQKASAFARAPVAASPPPQLFRSPTSTSYADRSSSKPPQYSQARPPQSSSRPSVSRVPLIRAPQPAASDMPRVKAEPRITPSPPQPRDSRPPIHTSAPVHRPTGDVTIGRAGDHGSGFIHIGANPTRVDGVVGRYGSAYGRNGHRFRPPYGYGHYYRNYPPIYYPGYRYYSPFYGYSYATVYLSEPYVVRVYDDSPTYVVSTYTQPVETTDAAPGTPPPAAAPPAAPESYQPLTPPQAASPVSEGNAAFAAGRYDEARDLYVRAVFSDERDGYAKVLYAWSNFALGDYDVAAAAIRRALLTTPDLVTYPMDLRTLYSDAATLDRQTDALLRFLADRPNHAEAQLVWGYLLYSIGQADRAASVFNGLAGADANDTIVLRLRDAAVKAAQAQSSPPPAP